MLTSIQAFLSNFDVFVGYILESISFIELLSMQIYTNAKSWSGKNYFLFSVLILKDEYEV